MEVAYGQPIKSCADLEAAITYAAAVQVSKAIKEPNNKNRAGGIIMAKALKCDRCGQFYDLFKEIREYRIINFSELKKNEKYVDLCPDCYEIFTKWLTGEKEQEIGTGELYPGEFEEESE